MEMRDWLILGAFMINVLGIVFACGMGWQMIRQVKEQMSEQEIRFRAIESRLPDINQLQTLMGVLKEVVDGLQTTLRNGISAQVGQLRNEVAVMRARCEERHQHSQN